MLYAWAVLFIKQVDNDDTAYFRLACVLAKTKAEATRLGYKELAKNEKATATWRVASMTEVEVPAQFEISPEVFKSKSFDDEIKKLRGAVDKEDWHILYYYILSPRQRKWGKRKLCPSLNRSILDYFTACFWH